MIKSATLLLAICCYSKLVTGQINIVDPIDLGPTGFNLTSTATGDWGATHGTPNYSPTTINMWAMHNQFVNGGEGVFRIVNFVENRSYEVTIAISAFTNPHVIDEEFNVLLANDPIPPNCAATGCPIPTLTSRLLYTYVGQDFNDKQLRLHFSTVAGESWKYLVIYPKATAYASSQINLIINCLGVKSSCSGPDAIFCNGQIPSGAIYNNTIFVGSSFCSGSPVYSGVFPTTMNAAKYIEVKPATTLSVNSGRTFTMQIEPCSIEVEFIPANTVNATLSDGSGPCAIGRPVSAKSVMPANDVKIFPNPTNGQFELSVNGDLLGSNVLVISPQGKLITNFKIEKTVTEVNLLDAASGMYFLQVSGKTITITKKIIKK